MKRLAGALMMTVTIGCATPPSKAGEPIHEHGTGAHCNAKPAQKLVGKAATKALTAQARRLSGATVVRTVPNGGVVTMDYREDRLNIHLDSRRKVARIVCG